MLPNMIEPFASTDLLNVIRHCPNLFIRIMVLFRMYGDAWKMWTLVTIDGARVRSQTIEGHAPEVDVGDGVGSEKVIAFFHSIAFCTL